MPHGKICYLEIPAHRAEDLARLLFEHLRLEGGGARRWEPGV